MPQRGGGRATWIRIQDWIRVLDLDLDGAGVRLGPGSRYGSCCGIWICGGSWCCSLLLLLGTRQVEVAGDGLPLRKPHSNDWLAGAGGGLTGLGLKGFTITWYIHTY